MSYGITGITYLKSVSLRAPARSQRFDASSTTIQRFTVKESFEEAYLEGSYNVTRAREIHLWFDNVFKETPHYSTAKALLSLFLKTPREVEKEGPKPDKTVSSRGDRPRDPPDDDEDDDSGWKGKYPKTSSWHGWSDKSSWDSQDRSQGSQGNWKSGSWSGAPWHRGKKPRTTRGTVFQSSSAVRVLSTMALFPVTVSSMQLVPATPVVSALSMCSVVCSLAWYLAGTSLSISALYAIPEVVDVAMQGVEDVVIEVVEGSKMVVRCISIGIMSIAAIAIVRVGYWFLARLTEKLKKQANPDPFVELYGGRLRGGMKGYGLTVKEIFGREAAGAASSSSLSLDPLEAARSKKAALEKQASQVDPERLEIGDEFSFVYFRGTRAGQRRTVILQQKTETATGVQLLCVETNERGVTRWSKYWPSNTADVRYPGEQYPRLPERLYGQGNMSRESSEEFRSLTNGQEGGRVTAVPLPSSSADSSVVASTKAALYPGQSHAGNDWRASKTWKDQQRAGKDDLAASLSGMNEEGPDWMCTTLGCNKPSWNRAPGEYCSRSCRGSGAKELVMFLTGRDMLPALLKELSGLESSICGLQYQADHTQCFAQLVIKIAKGVKGRFIFE